MKAKGCISEVLEWRTARQYFYWRIRRRQVEDPLKDRLVEASNGQLSLKEAGEKIAALLPAAARESDKEAAEWLEANIAKADGLVNDTKKSFAAAAVAKLLEGLSPEDIKAVLNKVK